MSWKKCLEASFGMVDRLFARHPSDKAKAKEAFFEAVKEGVDFKEFVKAARAFLTENGCPPKHIQKEIKKVKELKSYFD